MYGPLVGQLQSLHEGDQVQLVRKIAGKKHAMSALQITIPRGYDMVNRISQTKLNKVFAAIMLGALLPFLNALQSCVHLYRPRWLPYL